MYKTKIKELFRQKESQTQNVFVRRKGINVLVCTEKKEKEKTKGF